jgi:hypothetical protein
VGNVGYYARSNTIFIRGPFNPEAEAHLNNNIFNFLTVHMQHYCTKKLNVFY